MNLVCKSKGMEFGNDQKYGVGIISEIYGVWKIEELARGASNSFGTIVQIKGAC